MNAICICLIKITSLLYLELGQPVGVLDFIEMSLLLAQLNTHCESGTPYRCCSTFLIIIIPVANDATDVILDLCDYLCQPVPMLELNHVFKHISLGLTPSSN